MAGSNRKIQAFAVLKEVYAELETVTFPELFGTVPAVTFGDFDEENQFHDPERVHLVHRVRDGDQEWVSNRAKRETVTMEIDVVTAWKGRTGPQVLDRLEELVGPIYELWHPAAGGFNAPAAGLGPHILELGGVDSCSVNVFPNGDGDGYMGVASLTLQTVARITS